MEQAVYMSQTLLNFLLLTVSGGCGWFLRELWQAHKELRQELSALKEALPTTYAAKGDIDKGFLRLFDKLDEMREHFDKRMDAHEARYHKATPI
jgi:outer membrane lipopolysaccharide assembly protein LptE/RlpB